MGLVPNITGSRRALPLLAAPSGQDPSGKEFFFSGEGPGGTNLSDGSGAYTGSSQIFSQKIQIAVF